MKKFLALFATSSLAILGLTNCAGGDGTKGDADGNGIIDLSEYQAGAGFEFLGVSPPFQIERGGIAEKKGDTIVRTITLSSMKTANRYVQVADLISSYSMVDDTTAKLSISVPTNFLQYEKLAEALGQPQGTDFRGGSIVATITYRGPGMPATATVEITSTPPVEDDEEVEDDVDPQPNTVTSEYPTVSFM